MTMRCFSGPALLAYGQVQHPSLHQCPGTALLSVYVLFNLASLPEQGLGLDKPSPRSSGAAKSSGPVAAASDISAVLNYRS